jgi:hypothetical protein
LLIGLWCSFVTTLIMGIKGDSRPLRSPPNAPV